MNINKKVFPSILLLLMLVTSLVILSGGCGNGHDSSFTVQNNNNGVNSAFNGVWTSSNNGQATITRLNPGDEELPEEVLEQLAKLYPESYEIYQKSIPDESVSATVSSVTAIFDDCNISEDNGSMNLTASIIVNYENDTLPILLNGVNLATKRSGLTWTVELPDYDGSLTLSMASNGSITLSGNITYIDYTWEFSTVINKYSDEELLKSPSKILAGVWKFDNTETGAYMSSTGMVSNITPKDIDVSLAFGVDENNSVTSMAASYYVTINPARNALDNESSTASTEFTSIMTSSGELTQISGNLYKFTDTNSKETLIFIEDSEKIYVFTSDYDSDSDGKAYMYLPMTKSSGFNLESSMSKSWSASGSTNGGGYVHYTNLENSTDPINKALANLPYTLKTCALSFSDVNINGNTVTANVNLSSVFTMTSELFKQILNLTQDDLDLDSLEIASEQHTLDITGNILKLSMSKNNYESLIYISFISDSKALLTIEMKHDTGSEEDGTAKFVAVLSAAN